MPAPTSVTDPVPPVPSVTGCASADSRSLSTSSTVASYIDLWSESYVWIGGAVYERIAVLADVHCVLPALEAVLAEPDVRAADLIVLAGDVAIGPQPLETLELLDTLGDRV